MYSWRTKQSSLWCIVIIYVSVLCTSIHTYLKYIHIFVFILSGLSCKSAGAWSKSAGAKISVALFSVLWGSATLGLQQDCCNNGRQWRIWQKWLSSLRLFIYHFQLARYYDKEEITILCEWKLSGEDKTIKFRDIYSLFPGSLDDNSNSAALLACRLFIYHFQFAW